MDDDVITYCGRCGEVDFSSTGPAGEHAACRRALELEPPRYCPQCRRRMVVQVVPTGWTASCSRHGETAARTSA